MSAFWERSFSSFNLTLLHLKTASQAAFESSLQPHYFHLSHMIRFSLGTYVHPTIRERVDVCNDLRSLIILLGSGKFEVKWNFVKKIVNIIRIFAFSANIQPQKLWSICATIRSYVSIKQVLCTLFETQKMHREAIMYTAFIDL